jgi:hypothetical protein
MTVSFDGITDMVVALFPVLIMLVFLGAIIGFIAKVKL